MPAEGLSSWQARVRLGGGEQDAQHLAGMARGLLKRKAEALRVALEGSVNDHHRFCLKQLLAQYDFLNQQILEFDEEIGRQTAGTAEAISLLDTIPGIGAVAARALVAEIGTNMDQFPTAKSLCFLGGTVSWE